MRNSSTLQAPRRIFTLPARHGELSGPNRVRLSPRCGAGETVKPLMRAPDEVPGSCRPAPVLAEPDADPVAVAPDGIEQQCEVTTKLKAAYRRRVSSLPEPPRKERYAML